MSVPARARNERQQFVRTTPRDPRTYFEIVRTVARLAAARADAESVGAACSSFVTGDRNVAFLPPAPTDPSTMTERQWDGVRHLVADEFGEVEQAKEICRKLVNANGEPYPWRRLLADAFDPTRDDERIYNTWVWSARDRLSEQQIFYALNRCARELQKPTLRPGEYEQWRAETLRRDKRRWRHRQYLERLLPTSDQIAGSAGGASLDWDRALEIAGLEPREKETPKRDAVPFLEATVRFYEVTGFLPSDPRLEQFCKDFDFAYRRTKRYWHEAIAEIVAEIRARGLPEPPPYDPYHDKPSWVAPAERRWPDDPPHRAKTIYTHAQVIEAAVQFLAWLKPGQTPNQKAWGVFAKDRDYVPSMTVVGQHGGLRKLLREAQRPDAVAKAIAELNPSAEEQARREREKLEARLQHPIPQGFLRVLCERDHASRREIADELGVPHSTLENWIPLLRRAGWIEITTASWVAKNVRYCLPEKKPKTEDAERLRLERLVANHPKRREAYRLICERGAITSKEIGEELGARPETVAKWLRPLMKLGWIVQVTKGNGYGGGKRTWYEPGDASTVKRR